MTHFLSFLHVLGPQLTHTLRCYLFSVKLFSSVSKLMSDAFVYSVRKMHDYGIEVHFIAFSSIVVKTLAFLS